jgi:hypothetical protein
VTVGGGQAELRMRAKEDQPWLRWGKKWRERLGVDEEEVREAAERERLREEKEDAEDLEGLEHPPGEVLRAVGVGGGPMCGRNT